MRIFSDEGTPKSYSRMKISSVNTYTFTKKNPETNTWASTFVKLRLVPDPEPDQDKDYFSLDEAATMAGKDPDYLTRRLYDEINSNNKPTWNVYAQIIDPTKQGDGYYNIFDATKVVPDSQCTEVIKIGKITLNENPQNFFSQVEQAAFNPANVVPGWDISPDPGVFLSFHPRVSPPFALRTRLICQCSQFAYSCTAILRDIALVSTMTNFPPTNLPTM